MRINRYTLCILTICMVTALFLTATSTYAKNKKLITIDFVSFPDGTPIPNETVINNQFQLLGIVFEPLYPYSPRVLTNLGGILISGGPTGFYDDIRMDFPDCYPDYVTVNIIGSGLNITASLEAFDLDNSSLGTLTYTYTGNTGQSAPLTFYAPKKTRISSVLYNGGLNPSGSAASIAALSYECKNSHPINREESIGHP